MFISSKPRAPVLPCLCPTAFCPVKFRHGLKAQEFIEVTSIEVGPLVQTGSPMANNVDIISFAK